MFHLQEGYINLSLCRMFQIFPVKRLPGFGFPEREVVVSRPLSCPDMPAKRVLSRCICLRRLPALSSPLPHLSSAIFCWQPWNKGLLHIHQTAVKQGSSRKRRSSHLVPAIGLCWFHKHVGLVSSVFPFILSPVRKTETLKLCAKLTGIFFFPCHLFFTLFVSCRMTKRHIFTRSGPCVNVAQLDVTVKRPQFSLIFGENRRWIMKLVFL